MNKRVIFVQFLMDNSYNKTFLKYLHSYSLIGYEYIDYDELNRIKFDLLNLPNDIESLSNYSKNCNLCNLSKNTNTGTFSFGNVKSEVWIIDVTSSYYSNIQTNEFLDTLMSNSISLGLNDMYLTNILKCKVNMPLNTIYNEIDICIDYLYKEIAICQPKIIITLGETFNIMMNKNDNLLDIIGNTYKLNGIDVVPLYSLDYLIKNPSLIYKLDDGFKRVKKILES